MNNKRQILTISHQWKNTITNKLREYATTFWENIDDATATWGIRVLYDSIQLQSEIKKSVADKMYEFLDRLETLIERSNHCPWIKMFGQYSGLFVCTAQLHKYYLKGYLELTPIDELYSERQIRTHYDPIPEKITTFFYTIIAHRQENLATKEKINELFYYIDQLQVQIEFYRYSEKKDDKFLMFDRNKAIATLLLFQKALTQQLSSLNDIKPAIFMLNTSKVWLDEYLPYLRHKKLLLDIYMKQFE